MGKKIRVSYFFMKNPYMKFQNPSMHCSEVMLCTKKCNGRTHGRTDGRTDARTHKCPRSNMPLQLLRSWGHNDRRKYFMINLHKRILPTSAGVEPATSWSPIGRRIQLIHRGWPFELAVLYPKPCYNDHIIQRLKWNNKKKIFRHISATIFTHN